MHIPDGFLPTPLWLGGYAISGTALWFSLRQIDRLPNPQAGVPKASLLTAAFFVASWIHIPVPVPGASVHLMLNGLLGVLLGPFAFPAIAIGLFFQAVLFQHGGLSTLGVNAAVLGIPAMLASQLYRLRWRLSSTHNSSTHNSSTHKSLTHKSSTHLDSNKWMSERWVTGAFAAVAGAGGLLLSAVVFCALLIAVIPASFDVQAERIAIASLTVAHLPLALLEGAMTAAVVLFLERVKPTLLQQL
ncbi:MAG: CbiM family transporter [Synechococcus sp.]